MQNYQQIMHAFRIHVQTLSVSAQNAHNFHTSTLHIIHILNSDRKSHIHWFRSNIFEFHKRTHAQ